MRISHITPDGNEAYVHEVPQFGLGVFLMSDDGECKDSILCLLYTSPSPRDGLLSRMPSSA